MCRYGSRDWGLGAFLSCRVSGVGPLMCVCVRSKAVAQENEE